jgi:phage-related protein
MADPLPQPFWPFCPMPGHTKDAKLAVDINAFGDGYVHRSTRGLNPVRPAYGVTFAFTSDDEMAQMDTFLQANALQGFYYQPPGEAAPVYVTADEWTYTIQVKNRDGSGVVGTLAATFNRAFNPQPIQPHP